jgi:hypothetical protein
MTLGCIAAGKNAQHCGSTTKSSTIYSTMQDSDELIAISRGRRKWRIKTGPATRRRVWHGQRQIRDSRPDKATGSSV